MSCVTWHASTSTAMAAPFLHGARVLASPVLPRRALLKPRPICALGGGAEAGKATGRDHAGERSSFDSRRATGGRVVPWHWVEGVQNGALRSSLISVLLFAPASQAAVLPNGLFDVADALVEAVQVAPVLEDLKVEEAPAIAAPAVAVADSTESAEPSENVLEASVEEGQSSDVESESEVTAPQWLGPALILFPLVVYGGFNLYRDNLNPQATPLDFLFLLVALFIILNLITTLTLKIRLY